MRRGRAEHRRELGAGVHRALRQHGAVGAQCDGVRRAGHGGVGPRLRVGNLVEDGRAEAARVRDEGAAETTAGCREEREANAVAEGGVVPERRPLAIDVERAGGSGGARADDDHGRQSDRRERRQKRWRRRGAPADGESRRGAREQCGPRDRAPRHAAARAEAAARRAAAPGEDRDRLRERERAEDGGRRRRCPRRGGEERDGQTRLCHGKREPGVARRRAAQTERGGGDGGGGGVGELERRGREERRTQQRDEEGGEQHSRRR